MSRNSVNFISLGCLLGSIVIFYKYRSVEEMNKKLLSEIDSLKNNANTESNNYKNMSINQVNNPKNKFAFDNTDSNFIVDPNKIPLVYSYNHQIHNDLIFKFLINSYFPQGLIIIALKIFDFRNNNQNNKLLLENTNFISNSNQENSTEKTIEPNIIKNCVEVNQSEDLINNKGFQKIKQ